MREFFEDEKGKLSMIRLCTLILCVGAIVIAFVNPDHESGYLGIIMLALTGKVTQKVFGKSKTVETNEVKVETGN